jgi:hypothetical protein
MGDRRIGPQNKMEPGQLNPGSIYCRPLLCKPHDVERNPSTYREDEKLNVDAGHGLTGASLQAQP